ncbi:MAG TPA: hypothetical protein VGW34_11260 [Allosphingosinicella sp.]|nr:hypothetical protein [Allosphingosinicella sp.]
MILQVLLFALLAGAPPAGNLSQARQAYSGCLGMLLKSNLKERTASDLFEARLAQSCKAEEAAFRKASVAAAVATGASRAGAEQDASLEITDMLDNVKQRYKDYTETDSEPR